MAKTKYNSKAFDKYAKRMKELERDGLRALGLSMVDTVNLISGEAYKNSPRDTGKLQDKGWKSGSGRTKDKITGFVLNDVENEKGTNYASFTEEGTTRQRAQHYLMDASEKGMKALPGFIEERMEPIFKKVK